MENPFRRRDKEPMSDIEFLRRAHEEAILVVETSNARDYDIDDRELMQEMRRANPEAAQYSNWSVPKDQDTNQTSLDTN